MITWKLLLISTVLGAAAALGVQTAAGADRPSLKGPKESAVEVVRIKPSKGDINRVKQQRARAGRQNAGDERVYVIKLRVNMPPPAARGPILYIGDTRITEYGSFPEGIFVKVYDSADLDALRGKPLRFLQDKEVVELGVPVPNETGNGPGELPELRDVLKNK